MTGSLNENRWKFKKIFKIHVVTEIFNKFFTCQKGVADVTCSVHNHTLVTGHSIMDIAVLLPIKRMIFLRFRATTIVLLTFLLWMIDIFKNCRQITC